MNESYYYDISCLSVQCENVVYYRSKPSTTIMSEKTTEQKEK